MIGGMRWSKQHEACLNCGTFEEPHKGHGYCRRCYPLYKKKQEIIAWNSTNNLFLMRKNPQESERFRQVCIRQIDARLHIIKRLEQTLHDSEEIIDSMELEMLIRFTAKEFGLDEDRFFGIANSFTTADPQELKREFAYFLYKMRYLKRWGGINYGLAMRDSSE